MVDSMRVSKAELLAANAARVRRERMHGVL